MILLYLLKDLYLLLRLNIERPIDNMENTKNDYEN